MLDALNSHIWEKAFSFATSPSAGSVGISDILYKRFTREDVSRVIAIKEASKHNAAWGCLCRLSDRRYAFVYAGPYAEDKTWGSRGYGWAYTSMSLVDMFHDWVGVDCKKHFARSVRELAHANDVESDTKIEIAELALKGEI